MKYPELKLSPRDKMLTTMGYLQAQVQLAGKFFEACGDALELFQKVEELTQARHTTPPPPIAPAPKQHTPRWRFELVSTAPQLRDYIAHPETFPSFILSRSTPAKLQRRLGKMFRSCAFEITTQGDFWSVVIFNPAMYGRTLCVIRAKYL